MLISPAFAQAAGNGGGGSIIDLLLPLALIFIIFYFLVIRPQNKRVKEHQAMIGAVRRGDTVVTSGGLIGKVARVGDDELQVDLAEGVRVRVVKTTISDVRAKGEPAKVEEAKAKK